jgi:hypothetical protein
VQPIVDPSRESRLRALARRRGLVVRKDRARSSNIDHYGGYMLVDEYTNFIVGGQRFDLTIDDLEDWLTSDESA